MAQILPLPGDPDTVARAADRYLRTADSIQDAARELTRVASEIRTISLAVDEARTMSRELADVIDNAEDRYRGTAEALQVYAVALRNAQTLRNEAIAAHDGNDGDLDRAVYYRDHYRELAETPGPDQQEAIERYRTWRDRAEESGFAHDDAHQKANDAQVDLDRAAETAMAAISTAIRESDLNDTFWDHLQAVWEGIVELWETYVVPVLEAMVAFLEEYGWIVDVLALIFTIAAVFFPVLAVVAAALRLIALALTALKFLGTVALAASGERTWGDAVGAGISLALAAAGPLGKGMLSSGLSNISGDIALVVGQARAPLATVGQQAAVSTAAQLIDTGASSILTQRTMQQIVTSAEWSAYGRVLGLVGVDDAVDFAFSNGVPGIPGLPGLPSGESLVSGGIDTVADVVVGAR